MADNFEYSAAVSSLIFREFLARVQPGTGYKIVDSTEYRNAFDPHARVAKIFCSVGTSIPWPIFSPEITGITSLLGLKKVQL